MPGHGAGSAAGRATQLSFQKSGVQGQECLDLLLSWGQGEAHALPVAGVGGFQRLVGRVA